MKQSKRIPRRVASSLVRSLAEIGGRLETALGYVDAKHTYIDEDINRTNARVFKVEDASIIGSIQEFNTSLNHSMRHGKTIADEAFVTVARHSDLRVRYVATGTSVGLVITTGCIRRLLYLAANISDQQQWVDKNTVEPIYVCESPSNGYTRSRSFPPYFLRLLDIIRFMDETDNDMLEISLNGIEKDSKMHDSFLQHYSYTNAASAIAKFYPILSDRYQEDSWSHYLRTLYSGLIKEISVFAPASQMRRDIALSELNIIKV